MVIVSKRPGLCKPPLHRDRVMDARYRDGGLDDAWAEREKATERDGMEMKPKETQICSAGKRKGRERGPGKTHSLLVVRREPFQLPP